MKTISVSTLVAAVFLGPKPFPEAIVMHKDDNPSNNDYRNLEWGSAAQNSRQMTERKRQAVGERVFGSRLSVEKVLEIRKLKLEQGIGARRLSKMFGVGRTTITDILRNKIWKHI